jgi:hypothetical protein
MTFRHCLFFPFLPDYAPRSAVVLHLRMQIVSASALCCSRWHGESTPTSPAICVSEHGGRPIAPLRRTVRNQISGSQPPPCFSVSGYFLHVQSQSFSFKLLYAVSTSASAFSGTCSNHAVPLYHVTFGHASLTCHHRYGIAGLKVVARQKFSQELNLHLDSPDFPEACQEAYESTFHTDRGLRDVIIQAFRANPGLSLRQDVELVVRETPGLAFELFRMASGLPIAS